MSLNIEHLDRKVRMLESQLREATEALDHLRSLSSEQKDNTHDVPSSPDDNKIMPVATPALEMTMDEYRRYGRQLIMHEVGIRGQLRLRSSAVLIVGAGGLGCPAAAYLAGAGVGAVGIIDGDTIEVSNLHRQILHTTDRIGLSKAESIAHYIGTLNPNVKTKPYPFHLTSTNALDIFKEYDLILDCTDMPASRYLVSDVCILARKSLVSGSALRTDGQLMVLNDPPMRQGDTLGGPCYRCVWPNPPPPDTIMSCGEAGILGPVVGTIGTLMALEGIKILSRERENPDDDNGQTDGNLAANRPPSLLIFSAYGTQAFRSIKLRGRRAHCKACSAEADVSKDTLVTRSLDYETFCGKRTQTDLLGASERIRPRQFVQGDANEEESKRALVVDVRERSEWEVCHIPGSINIPWSDMSGWQKERKDELEQELPALGILQSRQGAVYVICRLGNDSQLAVQMMKRMGLDNGGQRVLGHIEGGWVQWRKEVAGDWPDY